jgi:hypothetical protein
MQATHRQHEQARNRAIFEGGHNALTGNFASALAYFIGGDPNAAALASNLFGVTGALARGTNEFQQMKQPDPAPITRPKAGYKPLHDIGGTVNTDKATAPERGDVRQPSAAGEAFDGASYPTSAAEVGMGGGLPDDGEDGLETQPEEGSFPDDAENGTGSGAFSMTDDVDSRTSNMQSDPEQLVSEAELEINESPAGETFSDQADAEDVSLPDDAEQGVLVDAEDVSLPGDAEQGAVDDIGDVYLPPR